MQVNLYQTILFFCRCSRLGLVPEELLGLLVYTIYRPDAFPRHVIDHVKWGGG